MNFRGEDARGVKRGKCMDCRDCSMYESKDGMRCKCSHRPVSHERTDGSTIITSATSSTPYTTTDRLHTELPGTVSSVHSGQYQHQIAFSSPHNTSGHFSGYQTWPTCKASHCTKPVHYEQRFGYFEYCSPQCRDEDFLPEYNRKLAEDIRNFRQTCLRSVETVPECHSTSVKEQHSYRRVTVKTKPKKDLGLVFIKDENLNLLIVGTKRRKATELLQSGKIRLLDAVKAVSCELAGQKYVQVSDAVELNRFVEPKTEVELHLDGRQALKDQYKFFCCAAGKEIDRVFCIRPHPTGYGFQIDSKHVVQSVFKGSEAEKCGMQKGDSIKIYTVAQGNTMLEITEDISYNKFEKDTSLASEQNFYLIVGVHS